MKVTKIGFVGIPVTDMKRARAFYEGVLGLEVAEEMAEGKWIEYSLGDDTLAIANLETGWLPSDQGTGVALEVEDFDAAINKLRVAVIRFAWEPFESPICRMAIVQDPDGNKIIIHKVKTAHEKGGG
ncbi:MAG: VOC family protein [Chthoniobacterales bacterium]|nr:VOC family protein [Chthoniobacterales bacterium]